MWLCVAGLVTPDIAKKRGAFTLNIWNAQSLKCESNTLFRNITQRQNIAPRKTQVLNKTDGEILNFSQILGLGTKPCVLKFKR
jgi:hypothetical protein